MARRRPARKIFSWNVNGIRAAAKAGFAEWLAGTRASVVGVQETRARIDQVPEALRAPKGFRANFSSAERGGYSGVALYSRHAPDSLETSLGEPGLDAEGRLQIARFGPLTVVNAYFPNGSGPNRDHSRVPVKLDFYRRLFDRLEPARAAGERIVVMGDFNTAHTDLDLARPKQNHKTSGFLPEEREEFDRWLRCGWIDTFRQGEPGAGHYTWWSQRAGCRARNVGWRIDYVLASPGAYPFVREAQIHSAVYGSDHCPISISVDPELFE
ncbi:MAG: exodeoxyribonuclease III [Planctomycetes bacterium]|nr:exodeoxyribonuclease III [Planctomycetota bacterium]